ncbi:cation:proton antiporter [Opitutus terrae]|uniref:Sodium/hydrogen exchanger n=1 Tax=Opitutus terrae (strain DSM 11246 / JCM 15787 / PB90-1) TaxID=452637 RepID=B1ZQX0_OPITP|nr:cation:proton antiporter [Opitutus terrae]ACB77868.1 sodium/hydrogen exchanger [Opitutus terrae PB90-1]
MQGIHLIQDLAVILIVAGVVGWICQRIGLSVVVGFLAAGMLVGPHLPRLALVEDAGRIETLAQLGLVFLMFSIGMQLSLRRLRRLGLRLLLATLGGAIGVYYLTRLLGATLGWSSVESLFLAGMLMVSSSAIISQMLQESAATHERFGQLAMGLAVLEDVVAVVMLTLLSSVVQFGGLRGEHAPSVGETIGMLAAFIALACIGGLLLVPWLLRRMSIAANDELQTLGIAALLFGLAVVAQRAGYSLALGAFLLGTIVAETAHRHQVERTFEGMRDVFTAVFFVAIGMQIDPGALVGDAWLVVGIAAFALVVRPLAVTLALTIVGTPLKDALRTGLSVTAIGEFSFIIAQLGVSAAVVPAKFYPLAVGVSLVTALIGPVLLRRSEPIADFLLARQPHWLEIWLRYYYGRLERMRMRQRRNRLWQLSRKRFIQIGVEIIAVSGVLVFSGELEAALEERVGRDWLFPHGPEVIFWVLLCVVLLAPLVAIWRNVSALALIYAQATTASRGRGSKLTPAVEWVLKAGAGLGLFVWLALLLPTEGTARLLMLGSALAAIVALLLLRQRLIFWHSHLEAELQTVIESADHKLTGTSAPWLRPHSAWNLHILDCVIRDLADAQGRSIAELDLRARFGCSVVGIERQGFTIPLPSPDAVLYPRDRVLLMGTREQVHAGRKFLAEVSGNTLGDSIFEEVQMQALVVPEWSRAAGRTLGELGWAQAFGVQIAGINRGGLRMLNPTAEESVQAGDELLALGAAGQIEEFKLWLRERPEEEGAGEAGENG